MSELPAFPKELPEGWQTLQLVGDTRAPQRPYSAGISAAQKIAQALSGKGQITTNDIIPFTSLEAPALTAQGLRDLISLLTGPPKQSEGRMEFDPKYNPLLPFGGA